VTAPNRGPGRGLSWRWQAQAGSLSRPEQRRSAQLETRRAAFATAARAQTRVRYDRGSSPSRSGRCDRADPCAQLPAISATSWVPSCKPSMQSCGSRRRESNLVTRSGDPH